MTTKFSKGDILVNKEDNSKITILSVVGDQYAYLKDGESDEDNRLYDFIDYIEAQYEICGFHRDTCANTSATKSTPTDITEDGSVEKNGGIRWK